MTYQEYRDAVALAYKANFQYHVKDDPIMPDADYDRLFRSIQDYEEAHPTDVLPNSPTHYVGMRVDGANDLSPITHKSLMGSLENVFNYEELETWFREMERLWMGYWKTSHLMPPLTFTCEPKYDGLAVSLMYNGGILISAGTRGDGVTGEDVTANALMIPDIPREIPYKGVLEVRGEAYMRRSSLKAYNEVAAKPLKNCRNGAAGTLRQSDPWLVTVRQMSFSAYAIGDDAPPLETHHQAIEFLRDQGFHTCQLPHLAEGLEQLTFYIESFANERRNLDLDTDGMVIKVDDRAFQNFLGYASRCPRWARAYKYPSEEGVTILAGARFQVGRTGKITPVADLTPVDIGGVTVTKATLHNMAEIERLKLAIGFPVRVVRGGEVIPKIIGRACDGNAHIGTLLQIPTQCPCCGSELVRYPGIVDIFCTNDMCRDKLVQGIDYVASRSVLDIDGIGPEVSSAVVERLLAEGVHMHPAGILYLQREVWIAAAGEANGEKIYNQILSLRAGVPLRRFITALCIEGIGVSTAGKLAKAFGSIEALARAEQDEFLEVEDVGRITAAALYAFFRSNQWTMLCVSLDAFNIHLLEECSSSDVLKGKTFVITGSFDRAREILKGIIEDAGGRVSGSVSSRTDYVLAGEGGGSKRDKAEALGIPCITETQLMDMLV